MGGSHFGWLVEGLVCGCGCRGELLHLLRIEISEIAEFAFRLPEELEFRVCDRWSWR